MVECLRLGYKPTGRSSVSQSYLTGTCRFVYAFANQRLCSKRTAGEWALVNLDTTWRSLIEASLKKYARGVADDQGPDEALRAFERHCLDRITSLRSATPWQSPK